MDPGLRAVLILIVIFGFIYAGRYMRYRMRMFEMKLKAEKEFSGNLKDELEQIRTRLATLERIVTDKGYRVREEIDNL